VAPALLERLGTHLLQINSVFGITLVLVEHRLEIVERICGSVVVLAAGRKLAEGTMETLRRNEEVIEAYLGTGVSHERP
ncbi:MAG: ABC transporter ATP-binding protein, partial [Acidimicrobiales bacterium]